MPALALDMCICSRARHKTLYHGCKKTPLHSARAGWPKYQEEIAVQHFEGFDPEGYSIYFVDYKYPEENTVNFIVMNKVPLSAFAVLLPCWLLQAYK